MESLTSCHDLDVNSRFFVITRVPLPILMVLHILWQAQLGVKQAHHDKDPLDPNSHFRFWKFVKISEINWAGGGEGLINQRLIDPGFPLDGSLVPCHKNADGSDLSG